LKRIEDAMPKVLVAGEKAFFIHSFTDDELNRLEIFRTRNDSSYRIGAVLDDDNMTSDKLESIRSDVMMLLKQSQTWKKSDQHPELDGFSLLVYRGRNKNSHKAYIATWCGQSKAAMLSKNPEMLIKQFIQGFKGLFVLKDYHKKSVLRKLIKS
jgi:hypothetical protein